MGGSWSCRSKRDEEEDKEVDDDEVKEGKGPPLEER
jgi:hypothetical protein